MNKGLPDRLKAAFPNIIPEARPLVPNSILESKKPEVKHWMAGFVSGSKNYFWIKHTRG
jgi:hypothetical protein